MSIEERAEGSSPDVCRAKKILMGDNMEQRKSGRAEPHYYSDRLKRKLDKLRFAPATVVEAPSGYGKTTAIRDFLQNELSQSTPVYWFTVMDENPAAAFRRLCREVEKIDSYAGERLSKIGLPNAVTIGEATEVLRSVCSATTSISP